MKSIFIFEVCGNFGENGDGETVHNGICKTLEEVIARIKELDDVYESYNIYKVNNDDERDFRIVFEYVKPSELTEGRITTLLDESMSEDEAYKLKEYIEDGYKTSGEII